MVTYYRYTDKLFVSYHNTLKAEQNGGYFADNFLI